MNDKTSKTTSLLGQSFLYIPHQLFNLHKFFIFPINIFIAWFTIQWNTTERKYEYLFVLEFLFHYVYDVYAIESKLYVPWWVSITPLTYQSKHSFSISPMMLHKQRWEKHNSECQQPVRKGRMAHIKKAKMKTQQMKSLTSCFYLLHD